MITTPAGTQQLIEYEKLDLRVLNGRLCYVWDYAVGSVVLHIADVDRILSMTKTSE